MTVSSRGVVGRMVNGGATLCLSWVMLAGVDVWGETASDSLHSLDTLIVSASRVPQTVSRTSRTVTVLDRELIGTAPVTDVEDLLEYAHGVDVRRRGPNGVQADVVMRGGTFEQTLILVDGIAVNDPQTGHHNLDLPISLGQIERIEVLHGHGSRLYGPTASGGAINIITKDPTTTQLRLRHVMGQHGLRNLSASASFPTRRGGHGLAFRRSSSAGFRRGTEWDTRTVTYRGKVQFGALPQKLLVGYVDKEFGAADFYVNPSNEEERTRALVMHSGGSVQRGKFTIGNKLYWRRHHDEWFFDRTVRDAKPDRHTTDSYGGELQVSYNGRFGKTAVALRGTKETIASTSLGDHDRYHGGVLAEHHLLVKERLDVVPGISAYHYSDLGWRAWPGLDLGFMLIEGLKLYASGGSSFRLPSFTELHMDHPVLKGDPALGLGEAISAEGGVRYRRRALSAAGAVFRREASRMIDWIIDNRSRVQHVRAREITVNGGEATVDLGVAKLFPKIPVSKLSLDYTYLDYDLDETAGGTSKYLANPAQHQAGVTALISPFPWLENTWHASFEQLLNGDNYTIVDTRLAVNAGGFAVFVEATNLLDVVYYDNGWVRMPGRWLRAGAELAIGW